MSESAILVIGGCGYLARALVPQLLKSDQVDEVNVLLNLPFQSSPRNLAECLGIVLRLRNGDSRIYRNVASATRVVDSITDLAPNTGADSTDERRAETLAVNREGTGNVPTATRKFDVETVVFATSSNNCEHSTSTDIAELVCDKLDRDLEITDIEDEPHGHSCHVRLNRPAERSFAPERSIRGSVWDSTTRFTRTRMEAVES